MGKILFSLQNFNNKEVCVSDSLAITPDFNSYGLKYLAYRGFLLTLAYLKETITLLVRSISTC